MLLGSSLKADGLTSIKLSEIWFQGWFISIRLLLGSMVVGISFAFLSGVLIYILLSKQSNLKKIPKKKKYL